ncbi:MAG: helix-turn-helix domain-containing protein [Candidatus Odinarchaeota archaeon]|nr:helix-turn-helix domain-containing protein [Candidatus Odinarchaeota archaeon]
MSRRLVIKRILTEKEYVRILREEEKEVAIKAYAILLLSRGYREKEVARILGVTDRTVRNWLNSWNSEGVDGLRRKKGVEEDLY